MRDSYEDDILAIASHWGLN